MFEPLVLEDEVIFLADAVDVADAFELALEVGAGDHLQRQLQLQLYAPRQDILLEDSIDGGEHHC